MKSEGPHCPFCGRPAGIVYVSSHYQCAGCGQVIESCCTGEQAQPATTVPVVARLPAVPDRLGALRDEERIESSGEESG